MSKMTVSIKLTKDFINVRLVVSEQQTLSNPVYSAISATTATVAKITMDGLKPNTQYYYGVMLNNILQEQGRGKFKTFPNGPGSFRCAFASCANTGSNSEAFDYVRFQEPLFFIHMGDLHYQDISVNDVSLFDAAYDTVFSQARQAQLYANVPIAYVWDDHDYGMNDGDSTHPAKAAAQLSYRKRVPHYDLPAGNTTASPIYQSFVCGRVRFILTDIMSERSPKGNTDNASKSMMGNTQLQWFYNELLKPEPVKIWVTTKPYVGAAVAGVDYWAGYSTERRNIANFIKNNGLEGRVMVFSGDMHALAIDDGTNTGYATGGGGAMPVFQAAPLHRTSSIKGGGWTYGAYTNGDIGQQFGVMNVTDNGTTDNILIEWVARRANTVVATHTMSIPSSPYVKP